MRFRKSISAKSLNLAKTTFGKIGIIATFYHAGDHFVVKAADFTMFFKCGHGAAQLIGLTAGKTSGNNGNLHGLFLKQRHTKRALQHRAQFCRWVGHTF